MAFRFCPRNSAIKRVTAGQLAGQTLADPDPGLRIRQEMVEGRHAIDVGCRHAGGSVDFVDDPRPQPTLSPRAVRGPLRAFCFLGQHDEVGNLTQGHHAHAQGARIPRALSSRYVKALTAGWVGGSTGWEAGIRTPIPRSRAACPTIERPPNGREEASSIPPARGQSPTLSQSGRARQFYTGTRGDDRLENRRSRESP